MLNDAEGVLIRVTGRGASVRSLIARMEQEPPPLASIDGIEISTFAGDVPQTFEIGESASGQSNTEVTPDAAICADCANDIFDPFSRRFRYPFTTCTHCGPRLIDRGARAL